MSGTTWMGMDGVFRRGACGAALGVVSACCGAAALGDAEGIGRVVSADASVEPMGMSERGVACGTDSLTQSTNPNAIAGNGVWCGDLSTSDATSLARSFIAPYDMVIECVTFGVRSNTGGAWPVEVRILQGDVNSSYGSLVLRDSFSTMIPNGASNQFVTLPSAGVLVAGGTPVIIELHTPSRLPGQGGDGGLIQLGFNGAGQSAPTYFRSDSCAEPDFVDLATLGFPGRHLVMSLGVRQATAATILVGGFEYQSLGGAALNMSGQTLQVAGDPVNGPWGVSIPIGATSMGVESPGIVWEGSAGSGVTVNFNSASSTDSMTLMGTSDVEAVLLAEFAEPLQDTFDVRVLSGGQVVGVFPN